MIINRLVLHNFGVYASTNEFYFHGEKPIVLIGGMNGRGKTTFLEAVLLALYGSNSFAYTESDFTSYNKYLRSYVNMNDGTKKAYIDMEFSLDEKEIYRVVRRWNALTARTTEKIQVYKAGEYNQFLTDNWSLFMENILPSALANFFFFDGEKIAEMAADSTSAQMKESIKALLGINVLDNLEGDLARIVSRISKNRVNDDEVEILDKLRGERDDVNNSLNRMDDQIDDLKKEIIDVGRRIEKAQQKYSLKGGDLINQRQELYKKRMEIEVKIGQEEEIMLNDAAAELPLNLVKGLLLHIRESAEIEQNQKLNDVVIERMALEIDSYKAAGNSSVEIEKFLQFIQSNANQQLQPIVFGLSDVGILQLQNLLEKKLSVAKSVVLEHQKRYKQYKKDIELLENYLAVEIDEKAVEKIYRQIKTYEQEKDDLEIKLKNLLEIRKKQNGMLVDANAEFNKRLEKYLKNVESNDDAARVLKYSHLATKVITEYRIRLQKQKTQAVAEAMTECYKKLANKKKLIEKIVMDSTTLDLTYLDADGVEIAKMKLSAGEKQLMVISLLWALAICSKRRLPVIIDTPLSRLDSVHREALINAYFPEASKQTIVLSTDSEIDKKYYAMMKPNVGDEFTLIYNDESNSTSIRLGYLFQEEM